MTDHSLRSPITPHFFQPLLPGFHTHLNIPVAFFSKHVEGRNDHIKTAKLRTDASSKIWLVKINGLKLTDGWEDFAAAHEFRIGDIIILRHEGEMVFHVTAFGPSCCDIQYTSASSSHNTNDHSQDQTNNTGNSPGVKRKRVKKDPRTKEVSSSDHSQFVAHVSPSSLRFDRLYVPTGFTRSNGLDKMNGEEIILLNEEGRSWNFKMKYNEAGLHTFVRPGWRRFCAENGMKKGHQYTFELVRKSPPVIRLCSAEHELKPAPESSSLHHSSYVGSASSNSLRTDKLYLQRKFVIANGLDRGFSEIILKNEWGGSWNLGLRHYDVLNNTYLGPGWKIFCRVNGIKAGDSFMLKLVETGGKPVLLLCSSNRGKTPLEFPEVSDDDVHSLSSDTSSEDDSREESQESEEESLEDEGSSHESFEMEKRENMSRCRVSSSYSQRFVKLTLTQRALENYKLVIPLGFTRVNGISKPRKIKLIGNDGVKKQEVDLLQHNRLGIMRIGKGWREFCEDHGVKVGDSFMLELIWDEEANPVLKFCTKL